MHVQTKLTGWGVWTKLLHVGRSASVYPMCANADMLQQHQFSSPALRKINSSYPNITLPCPSSPAEAGSLDLRYSVLLRLYLHFKTASVYDKCHCKIFTENSKTWEISPSNLILYCLVALSSYPALIASRAVEKAQEKRRKQKGSCDDSASLDEAVLLIRQCYIQLQLLKPCSPKPLKSILVIPLSQG